MAQRIYECLWGNDGRVLVCSGHIHFRHGLSVVSYTALCSSAVINGSSNVTRTEKSLSQTWGT
jgi:hypothetical protein